ncbi:hypothetical protein M23134_06790 [Microscilla marina ATCC 23134]|uniref:Outer membrane protein beta-barrel domain-containing protein n=2 Tax=Microscilla marina TaxID=1027 RepID=A1ZWR2_MICM2|nr:hypothetical protein M23134_06790 [Microscilla marina ATCC 23134]
MFHINDFISQIFYNTLQIKNDIMRKSIFTLCLLGLFALCTTNTSQAQIHFGFDVSGGFPLNEFQAQNPNTGVGINLNAFFPFAPQVPVYIGLDFGFQGMGTRNIQKNINVNIINTSIPINFDIATSNNLINGHAILRTKIPLPLVQPYFEGLIGFKHFYTRTSIKNITSTSNIINVEELQRNSEIAGETLQQSTALSYGFGGGFHIMFGGGQFGLNLGARYLLGGQASYYTREDIRDFDVTITTDNGTSNNELGSTVGGNNIQPRTSRTDMIMANIGIVIKL